MRLNEIMEDDEMMQDDRRWKLFVISWVESGRHDDVELLLSLVARKRRVNDVLGEFAVIAVVAVVSEWQWCMSLL